MPDLSYSDEALNVRGDFFGVKAIIYVEGDDDVLFWEEIFSRVTDEPFEVESVGGAPLLDAYIGKIADGRLAAIAARDADFLALQCSRLDHPRVLYTFGYSIENSLYIDKTLFELVRVWCKSPKICVDECVQWLTDFAQAIAPLVRLDAANAISCAGIPTLGDNCSRFMSGDKTEVISKEKVSSAVAQIEDGLDSESLQRASAEIGSHSDRVLVNVRGHFLASAVHRYIVARAKTFGKKVSLSAESLYAAAMMNFSRSLDSDHPHSEYYLQSARTAWASL